MSSDTSTQQTPAELNDEVDFEALLSPDGLLSICGFGSLLSERSARSTFPDLINFRVARLNGFRRVFAHAAPFDTNSWIEKGQIRSFMERELEFRFLAVVPETLDGKPYQNPAVLCARYSDEEFFRVRCKGSKEIYFQHYGQFGIDKIWVDDIFPCRVYLRHCVLAANNLGDMASNNFLDHTFLGDRKTTIREYLATAGSGIMEEEPPESIKSRYEG
ncbi:hypothetical protein RJ641_004305 [Dillenia turbinata]|uniref:Uncharacterized protein n=1 Tax=Dillenia turbinata TaxID=194707 RepID=A0AAN8Z9P9_9MAGN